MGWLFYCIEREGNLKDTHCNTQNGALNVDLFYYTILYKEIDTLLYFITDKLHIFIVNTII